VPLHPPLISETAFVLHRLLAFQQPADAVLAAYFRDHRQLGRQDRAFIADTAYAVLRRLRTLEHLAGGREPRRLILAWLARFGGHNLREFSPIAKGDELEWLKGVKAVDLMVLPEPVRLDLPDWLHARLVPRFGAGLAALAEALNRPAPLDVRVNVARMSREAVLANLTAEGLVATPTPYSPWGLRLAGKPALNRHPLFLEGVIEVQDEGSQLLALLTGAVRGEMVCDFCAGAGGKTLALGTMMHNRGRLYAFDISERRLANLKPRLARSGLSNVHPQRIDRETDPRVKRLAGKFDRVLVDAPCSGLGTLRRNPDLKWRQTPESVAELVARQDAILVAAARLVKPGGRLVYATCSLLEEENEARVEALLTHQPGFVRIPAQAALAAQGIGLECGEYMHLSPDRQATDGFFAAVLERAGE